MQRYLFIFLVAVVCVPVSLAQQSPYAGGQEHNIKALSSKEIEDYFAGAGMGLAKAAELNSYPGPKHVLELADKLQLTEQQILKTKEIMQAMKDDAVRLGRAVVHQEHELDKLFASKTVELKALKSQTERIAKLQGELRAVHLSAHLAMKQQLSAEQITKYDELLGYSKQNGASHDMHMNKH